jgi:hypothetical protein
MATTQQTKPSETVRAARAAGPGLAKLKTQLDALAAKLAPAGITREQIVEALRQRRVA